MVRLSQCLILNISMMAISSMLSAQTMNVMVEHKKDARLVNVTMDGKPFTSLLYTDTLEKPVLYPIIAANGTDITRGFPLNTKPGDPTDHPHHIGLWMNYESLNGLDFWNNSYAIPNERKHLYGWIKTDKIIDTKSGKKGSLTYHANWTNQANETIVEETTTYEFSGELQ